MKAAHFLSVLIKETGDWPFILESVLWLFWIKSFICHIDFFLLWVSFSFVSLLFCGFHFCVCIITLCGSKAFKNTFGSFHSISDIYFINSQNAFSSSQLRHIPLPSLAFYDPFEMYYGAWCEWINKLILICENVLPLGWIFLESLCSLFYYLQQFRHGCSDGWSLSIGHLRATWKVEEIPEPKECIMKNIIK